MNEKNENSGKKDFILMNAIVQAFFACCVLASKDIPNWMVISTIVAGGSFAILYSYDDDKG